MVPGASNFPLLSVARTTFLLCSTSKRLTTVIVGSRAMASRYLAAVLMNTSPRRENGGARIDMRKGRKLMTNGVMG